MISSQGSIDDFLSLSTHIPFSHTVGRGHLLIAHGSTSKIFTPGFTHWPSLHTVFSGHMIKLQGLMDDFPCLSTHIPPSHTLVGGHVTAAQESTGFLVGPPVAMHSPSLQTVPLRHLATAQRSVAPCEFDELLVFFTHAPSLHTVVGGHLTPAHKSGFLIDPSVATHLLSLQTVPTVHMISSQGSIDDFLSLSTHIPFSHTLVERHFTVAQASSVPSVDAFVAMHSPPVQTVPSGHLTVSQRSVAPWEFDELTTSSTHVPSTHTCGSGHLMSSHTSSSFPGTGMSSRLSALLRKLVETFFEKGGSLDELEMCRTLSAVGIKERNIFPSFPSALSWAVLLPVVLLACDVSARVNSDKAIKIRIFMLTAM